VHYYGAHPVSQVFRFQHVQQYIQTYRAGKLTGPRTGNPAGDLALPRGTPGPPGYLRRPGETVFLPFVLGVLRFEHGRLTDITAFEQPSMFTAFGLPVSL